MSSLIQSIFQQVKKYKFFDTFKHASTYFSGKLIVQALAIITLPVYTYYLDTGGYGIITTFGSMVSMLTILLSFNLNGAIGRYYFEEKPDLKEFIGTSFVSAGVVLLVLGSIFYYFRGAIAARINLPEEVMVWALLIVFATSVWRSFEMLFVAKKESKTYATNEIIYHYGKFGLALVGILVMTDSRFLGKIQGEAIAAVLVSFYLFYKLMPYVKLHFSWEHFKYICYYTLPLIPYILSGQILVFFDQFYINANIGHDESGLYYFAYKIGMMLSMLLTALLNAASPDFYKWMNAETYHDLKGQVISIIKLLVLGAGFLILFAGDLGDLLASKDSFNEALPLIPIIVLAYIFFGVAQIYNRYIFFQKKNFWLAVIMLSSGLLNIYLNYTFIPMYGYHAAAYTTLASYVFMMLISWFVNSIILKQPKLPLLVMFRYVLLVASLLPIYYFLMNLELHYIFGLLLRALVFGIFALIIFWRKVTSIKFDK